MKSQVNEKSTTRKVTLLLTVTFMLPMMLSALTPMKSDYVDFGFNTGYSVLVGNYRGMDVFGGFSGALHLGYEYRDSRLWISTTGELQYISSNCQSDIQVGDVHFYDTRMTEAVMSYKMMSKLKEMQNFGIAGVTLMAGYCTGTHVKGGFYAGAGIKLGVKFDFSNTLKQKYATTAYYPDYIDPYHDMDNHYYGNYETNDTAAFGTKVNFSVLAEAGWDLRVTKCDKLKIGFFVEAGLTNLMRNIPVREATVNPYNVSQIYTYSAYNRSEMENKYIVPIVAGIKVSLLFNVSRLGDRCHTCPCYRKRR